MNDREAFLAAVLARPEDDLPRMIYADIIKQIAIMKRAGQASLALAGPNQTATLDRRAASWLRSILQRNSARKLQSLVFAGVFASFALATPRR